MVTPVRRLQSGITTSFIRHIRKPFFFCESNFKTIISNAIQFKSKHPSQIQSKKSQGSWKCQCTGNLSVILFYSIHYLEFIWIFTSIGRDFHYFFTFSLFLKHCNKWCRQNKYHEKEEWRGQNRRLNYLKMCRERVLEEDLSSVINCSLFIVL